jgi:hypothetical protein
VTKHGKNFIPSGLDEVFARMMKRKEEAIANGWIKDGVVQTKTILDSLAPKPEKKAEAKP